MPFSVSTIDVLVGEGSLLPSVGHWLLFGGWPLPQLLFGPSYSSVGGLPSSLLVELIYHLQFPCWLPLRRLTR